MLPHIQVICIYDPFKMVRSWNPGKSPLYFTSLSSMNLTYCHAFWASLMAQQVKESTCSAGDVGSIPGLGRYPGEGNDYPLQYSCLWNPMDRGAWWATVQRVIKSRTQLSMNGSISCISQALKWFFKWMIDKFHWILGLFQVASISVWPGTCFVAFSIRINTWEKM